MTYIPLPQTITRQIADRAMQFAQQDLRDRRWRSSGDIHAAPGDGEVGLRVGRRYLIYQSAGTRPYLMKSLEGRVINIDGNFVTVSNVGKPGYVRLPGGVRKWRDQRWRHPGLQPQRFLEASITYAIHEARPMIRSELMRILGGAK